MTEVEESDSEKLFAFVLILICAMYGIFAFGLVVKEVLLQ
jgi:hypothetical protein